jgi:hypothetical protein
LDVHLDSWKDYITIGEEERIELGKVCREYDFSCRDIYAISEKVADHIRNPSEFPEEIFRLAGDDLRNALASSYIGVDNGIIMGYLVERKEELDEEDMNEKIRGSKMKFGKKDPVILKEYEKNRQEDIEMRYISEVGA